MKRLSILYVAWAGSLFLMPLMAAGQTSSAQPTPPTKLCIDDQCPPEPVVQSDGIKWHPGHYVWFSEKRWNPENQAAHFKWLDEIGSDTSIKGIQLDLFWGYFEGPQQGDYSAGFAIVDAYLKKLSSLPVPKRLMLIIHDRAFGQTSNIFPQYLVDKGWAIVKDPAEPDWPGSLTAIAKTWDPLVMDRYIAMYRAYGARYNQHPLVEMVAGPETATGVPDGYGYDYAPYLVQLKRWLVNVKSAWPNTQVRLQANYMGNKTQMLELVTFAKDIASIGGPDPELPLPDITKHVWSNRVFRGLDGGTDLREIVPWVGEVQQQGLGGNNYTETPAEIFDYQYNTMRANYMIWIRNTWSGGDAQKWSTGIYPYIRSIEGRIHSACPRDYESRCITN